MYSDIHLPTKNNITTPRPITDSKLKRTLNKDGDLAKLSVTPQVFLYILDIFRGGSRISGKGVRMCKGMGVRFADFISNFINILWT